uniref:Exonuclease domain-containing protein n=1 Tax=Globodera rostochiensis TaxID=31243 RepID=A0A914HQB1_GLORO
MKFRYLEKSDKKQRELVLDLMGNKHKIRPTLPLYRIVAYDLETTLVNGEHQPNLVYGAVTCSVCAGEEKECEICGEDDAKKKETAPGWVMDKISIDLYCKALSDPIILPGRPLHNLTPEDVLHEFTKLQQSYRKLNLLCEQMSIIVATYSYPTVPRRPLDQICADDLLDELMKLPRPFDDRHMRFRRGVAKVRRVDEFIFVE